MSDELLQEAQQLLQDLEWDDKEDSAGNYLYTVCNVCRATRFLGSQPEDHRPDCRLLDWLKKAGLR